MKNPPIQQPSIVQERRDLALESLFTVEKANRALVYIERIVLDIVSTYEDALTLRERLERRPDQTTEDRYEHMMNQLADLMQELNQTGADIKDFASGTVDFPAMLEGREVCLSWRLGEPEVMYWHEVNEAVGGRHEIEQVEY